MMHAGMQHTISGTISGPSSNYNMAASLIGINLLPYYYHTVINSGVTVSGTGSTDAFDTGAASSWHAGAYARLDQGGTVTGATGTIGAPGTPGVGGAGGPGAQGDNSPAAGPGSGGGTAPTSPVGGTGVTSLRAQRPIHVNNGSGTLNGGAGGAGGPASLGGGGGGGGGIAHGPVPL